MSDQIKHVICVVSYSKTMPGVYMDILEFFIVVDKFFNFYFFQFNSNL